jgi:hypothetical protein
MISKIFDVLDSYNFVGEIKGLRPESITPIYCIGCKKEMRGLPMSIHAFLFIGLI